jgi:methionine biosynthesis protein MetW
MDAKKHYETYWSKKTKHEEFWGYERNWVLPTLFKKDEKVLDVGCGDGAVAEYLMKEIGADVLGYDISEKAAKEAKKRGVRVVVGTVEEKLPFTSQSFDTVFWGDNMEHLFAPENTLSEIHRVLKKNGRIIMSCPNMGYWRYRVHYLLHGGLPDTEWTGNPPWAWSHIRFFNDKIIKRFLETYHFTLLNIIGINRRTPDKFLVTLFPSLFSMVLVTIAVKK